MKHGQRCSAHFVAFFLIVYCSGSHSAGSLYALRDHGPGTPVALNNRGEILAMITTEEGVLIHSPTNRTTILRRSGSLHGFNDLNEVVGWVMHDYQDEFFPRPLQFLWKEGVIQPLNSEQPEDKSSARAINNASIVAGSMYQEAGLSPGRWWNGAWENILLKTTEVWWLNGSALAINELGAVAGHIAHEGLGHEAFVWTEQGGLRRLGHFGATSSHATDLNDAGVVVGLAQRGTTNFAWEWKDGIGRVLNLPGATAPRVNNDGLIVSARFLIKDDHVTNIHEVVANPAEFDITLVDINNRGELLATGFKSGANHLLLLQPAPIILAQPAHQTAEAGQSAKFTVRAEGALSFQWHLNDMPLVGEIAATLTLTNVRPADAGFYHVTVISDLGVVTLSERALLTVTTTPLLRIIASPSPELILTSAHGTEFQLEARNNLNDGQWELLRNITLTSTVARLPLLDGFELQSRFYRAVPR